MKILIAGAGGFLGKETTIFFSGSGHSIFSLVRNSADTDANHFFVDYLSGTFEIPKNIEFDAIINYCGQNLAAKRWSPVFKKELLTSRIIPTQRIKEGIESEKIRTKLWVNISGIGFYGNRGEELLNEDAKSGENFLAQICKEWEKPVQELKKTDCRKIILRLGAVLSLQAGLLKQLKLPFSLGVGGKQGDGKQYLSWIGLSDLLRVLEFIISHREISGVFNLCAPESISNVEFSKAFAQYLDRPALFPAPAFLLKLMFGEMAENLILSGQRGCPSRLESFGFRFENSNLNSFFESLQNSIK